MMPPIITSPFFFLLGSPLKLAMWIGNRVLTWTGLMVLWRKLKHAPDRVRRFLLVGTGQPLHESLRDAAFVGTFLTYGDTLVFHLFDYGETPKEER